MANQKPLIQGGGHLFSCQLCLGITEPRQLRMYSDMVIQKPRIRGGIQHSYKETWHLPPANYA